MAATMKATLIKARPTVVENLYTQTQHNMMENGSMTDKTDLVSKHGPMVLYIKGIIATDTKMVKEISHGLMVAHTEGTFQIITFTVTEYTNGQMEGCIAVIG